MLKYARLTDEDLPALLVQRVARFRAKSQLDQRFLFYVIGSKEFTEHILAVQTGTSVPHISGASIKEFEFSLPPLPVQHEIARVLGTLDDKIELDRRMNATLEGLARAVFRSWFVDFDPVVGKASGRRPVGMTAATAALFPDTFEDSPLGPIPKGWKAGKVDELLSQRRDGVNPGASPLELFDHYSIPAFDNERRPVREVGAGIKSNKFLIPENAILLSKLNPDNPRVWLPASKSESRRICSTEFIVCTPKVGSSVEYLFGLFSSQEFTDEFATLVTGTSNSHQRVKPGDLTNTTTTIPPAEVRGEYRARVAPLLQRCFHNNQNSATLTALRDALLPRLLSGELRLKDAEKLAEAAT